MCQTLYENRAAGKHIHRRADHKKNNLEKICVLLTFTLLGVEVFLTDSNVHRVLNISMNVVEYFGNVKNGL